MAFINKEKVAKIRKNLKKAFPNLKLSVTLQNYSTVNVAIMAGDIDFSDILENREYRTIVHSNPVPDYITSHRDIFDKMVDILMGEDWEDNSDIMTDYFDVSYYFTISIGKFDKPYILTK